MARCLSERWNDIKGEFTLCDLMMDGIGKLLAGLGLGIYVGACLASRLGYLTPVLGVFLIGVGLPLSVAVKAKHWKRFWS